MTQPSMYGYGLGRVRDDAGYQSARWRSLNKIFDEVTK